MIKKYVIGFYRSIDPGLKKEIIFIATGTTIGWISNKLLKKISSKLVKKELNLENETIPKSRIRKIINRLKGGEIITIIATINELITLFGGIAGFVAYLKTLNKQEITSLFNNATIGGIRDLALFPVNSGIPVGPLIDISCLANYKMLEKILEDINIPFDEKKLAVERFLNEKINPDLKQPSRRAVFIFFIINLLLLLFVKNFSSFHILLAKLKLMFQSGKLSRALYYKILRELKKRGLPVNSDLDELLAN